MAVYLSWATVTFFPPAMVARTPVSVGDPGMPPPMIVLPCPPTIEESLPWAVLPPPPLTEEFQPAASLFQPALTEEAH